MQQIKGVKKFLARMKKYGIKMVVASGNKKDAIKFILGKTGILQYFKTIVTNQDVKKSKPAPDIFLKGAGEMGLKPEECVVFEDAVNGVKAAQSAGIPCICMLTTTKKTKLLKAGADLTVKDYTVLTDKMLFSIKNNN